MARKPRRHRVSALVPADSGHERVAGRPSALEGEAIHADILRAARAAFIECGYAGAGIEQIARDGKVAKITIYRRFGGKPRLFEQVAEQALQSTHERFQSSLDPGPNLRDTLAHIVAEVDGWARDASLQAILRLVAHEAPQFPAQAERLQRELESLIDGLTRQMQCWQAEGRIRVGDARLGATQLLVLAASCMDDLLLPGERMPAEQWQPAVVDLLLQNWCAAASA